jgi:hypothetical protein
LLFNSFSAHLEKDSYAPPKKKHDCLKAGCGLACAVVEVSSFAVPEWFNHLEALPLWFRSYGGVVRSEALSVRFNHAEALSSRVHHYYSKKTKHLNKEWESTHMLRTNTSMHGHLESLFGFS